MTCQSMRILQVNLVNVSVMANIDKSLNSRCCSTQTILESFVQQLCTSINGLDDDFDGQFHHGSAKHGT